MSVTFHFFVNFVYNLCLGTAFCETICHFLFRRQVTDSDSLSLTGITQKTKFRICIIAAPYNMPQFKLVEIEKSPI